MQRQLLFYTGIVLAQVLTFAVPSLFYVLAGGANVEWTLYGLISSNVPSIAGTLMTVGLIVFRSYILGAPRKH